MSEPVAWGVLPGDGLPLWRCSSKRQAERVVVWLREQRPESTPEAVPLVDGRLSQPTLTDAEVVFLKRERDLMDPDDEGDRKSLEIIDGLLERLG